MMPWPLPDAAIGCTLEIAQEERLKVGHEARFICWTCTVQDSHGMDICVNRRSKSSSAQQSSIAALHTAFEHLLSSHLLIVMVQNGHAGAWAVQGEIQEAEFTRYNPVDLFSGDLPRAQHAVMTMLETPARNLRLFSDGKRIANGEVRSFMADWLGLPPDAAISTAAGIMAGALHQSGAHMHRPHLANFVGMVGL